MEDTKQEPGMTKHGRSLLTTKTMLSYLCRYLVTISVKPIPARVRFVHPALHADLSRKVLSNQSGNIASLASDKHPGSIQATSKDESNSNS